MWPYLPQTKSTWTETKDEISAWCATAPIPPPHPRTALTCHPTTSYLVGKNPDGEHSIEFWEGISSISRAFTGSQEFSVWSELCVQPL